VNCKAVNTTPKRCTPLMSAKRMRVELFDSEGNKYSVAFEGNITREKALRLLDLVELLGGAPCSENSPGVNLQTEGMESTKYDKVRMLIQTHFPLVWFSSREVQSVYERELKEPIPISTISTYLARMATKGVLQKVGASNRLKYKSPPNVAQTIIRQQAPQ
jgi:hypothetical protein